MTEQDLIERRLRKLGAATEALRVRPGFTDRVMLALPGTPRTELSWWETLSASARLVIPIAALVALVSVGWAFESQDAVDESLAISYGSESYAALEVDF